MYSYSPFSMCTPTWFLMYDKDDSSQLDFEEFTLGVCFVHYYWVTAGGSTAPAMVSPPSTSLPAVSTVPPFPPLTTWPGIKMVFRCGWMFSSTWKSNYEFLVHTSQSRISNNLITPYLALWNWREEEGHVHWEAVLRVPVARRRMYEHRPQEEWYVTRAYTPKVEPLVRLLLAGCEVERPITIPSV